MILTRKIKLNPTPEQKSILLETLAKYRQCVQSCLEVGFQNKWTSGSQIHNKTYYKLREQTLLNSQLVCSARCKATEILKSIKSKTKGKWNTKQPTSRRFPTVRYDRNSCSYTGTGIKISTSQGRIEVPIISYPFVEGIWNIIKPTCELQYRSSKNEWFLLVFIEIETPVKKLNGTVLGIDRGIKHIAVLSDNTFIDSKHLRKVKGKYSYLRRKLASKGTKSAKRLLRKLSGKEHRFVRDANHCISKKIVNLPFDTFVLEKLTIKTKKRLGKSFNKRLMGWSWKQLETFLTYKADLAGKSVEYIDPRYTSQKCSVCGHIKRSNREGTSFKCTKCKFKLHADLNAARNIKNNYLHALRATSSESRATSTVHTSQALISV